jgi:hypothetical protein
MRHEAYFATFPWSLALDTFVFHMTEWQAITDRRFRPGSRSDRERNEDGQPEAPHVVKEHGDG